MSIHNAPERTRDEQLSALDDLLIAIGAGESRALVLRGEAGMGKTALLDYLAEQAVGYRVAAHYKASSARWSLRSPGCTGCAHPMLDRLERLPGPQR